MSTGPGAAGGVSRLSSSGPARAALVTLCSWCCPLSRLPPRAGRRGLGGRMARGQGSQNEWQRQAAAAARAREREERARERAVREAEKERKRLHQLRMTE